MRTLNPVLISALILCAVSYINGGILDQIKDGVDETNDAITETANKLCVTDASCNTSFLNINNYCCTFQCCNMFSYIKKNE